MKNSILKITVFLAFVYIATGCDYDNFDPPKSLLEGRVVYQGEPLGLRSEGVQLELWQPGYELFQKIPLHVDQDGTFSAALFDGDYKLTLIRGNGPWLDVTDSIDVQVRGGETLDVEVDPYYTLTTPQFTRNGGSLTANFEVNSVNPVRDVEMVAVYVGRTAILDVVRNEGNQEVPAGDLDLSSPVSINIDLPGSLSGRDVYVRVGVKTAGIQELVYSQVQHLQ
ncbi:MAG TPA: DUF3823 domain-containing protein [Cyclobacteriaceae bacterium]|nr:DUF3823 domain-containing protein [Cyclobacteriaceae bacterium]